jgi:RNase P subunit RPR2
MSYRSREKKRRAGIAQQRARRDHRETMKRRHYLTIVSRDACCNACGGMLRQGAECVYRFEPREILCVTCADLRMISYRPSLKWERAQKRKGR